MFLKKKTRVTIDPKLFFSPRSNFVRKMNHLFSFLLAVNEVSLENMSNDEAVGVLRDAVQKPAPIKLVVAKCWDPSPRGWRISMRKKSPVLSAFLFRTLIFLTFFTRSRRLFYCSSSRARAADRPVGLGGAHGSSKAPAPL